MVGWVSSKLPIVRKAGQFQSAVDKFQGRPVSLAFLCPQKRLRD
jgi:hypothetical protein